MILLLFYSSTFQVNYLPPGTLTSPRLMGIKYMKSAVVLCSLFLSLINGASLSVSNTLGSSIFNILLYWVAFDSKQRYGAAKSTCKCKHMGVGSSLCGCDCGCWDSGMSCIYLFSCSCFFIICLVVWCILYFYYLLLANCYFLFNYRKK